MKKVLDSIITWFESMGKARAASELARQGRYKEARALMVKE